MIDPDRLAPAIERLHRAMAIEPSTRRMLLGDVAEVVSAAEIGSQVFEIMKRTGWYSVPYETEKGTWIAMNAFSCKIERGGNTGTYFTASDPFMPLIEAYRWMKEQAKA